MQSAQTEMALSMLNNSLHMSRANLGIAQKAEASIPHEHYFDTMISFGLA